MKLQEQDIPKVDEIAEITKQIELEAMEAGITLTDELRAELVAKRLSEAEVEKEEEVVIEEND